MEGKGRNTSFLFRDLEAKKAKLADLEDEIQRKQADLENEIQRKQDEIQRKQAEFERQKAEVQECTKDYERKVQFDNKLDELHKELEKTSLDPMEMVGEVQRCYEEAKQ